MTPESGHISDEERERYAWQLTVPGFDEASQATLKGATVLISRCGGLGSPVAYELAAAGIGMDPLEFRRKNLVPDDAYPCKSVTGMPFEKLSHQAVLEKLSDMMDYDGVRAEQASSNTISEPMHA